MTSTATAQLIISLLQQKQRSRTNTMMAYENNNLANAPFADNMNMFSDALEPSRFEGKLDSNSLGALGFLEQLNNNISNNVNMNAQQQMNGFSNLQLQMNSQANFLNNNCMSSTTNQNNQNMNNFQQTTLMSSMILQQPFFQASQQQQSQQQRNVPNFIAFDNSLTSKPLPTAFEPKPLFGGMEPMPVVETSEPIKAAVSAINIPRSVSKSKRLLPADFQPCGNYVICGNKRKYFESKGNIRFREVCKLFLQEYIQAPTKIEKSAVVTKVMNILREDCPEGAFVSPQGGRWYAVSERTAREKVGTFFRDCLADSYKSSAKNKIARRKIIKKANSVNTSSSNSEENISDDNSLESISFYDVDDLTSVPL